jgi:hypothetical protein
MNPELFMHLFIVYLQRLSVAQAINLLKPSGNFTYDQV